MNDSSSNAASRRVRDDPLARGQTNVEMVRVQAQSRPCVSCGMDTHQVKDCIRAGLSGVVAGCPLCNMAHVWDDCPHRNGTDTQDFAMLVFERQNKPPLMTIKLNWPTIWDRLGRPTLLGLPWTLGFSRRMANQQELPVEFPNWDPDTVQRQLVGSALEHATLLPRDPATIWKDSPRELNLQDERYQAWNAISQQNERRGRLERSLSPRRDNASGSSEADGRDTAPTPPPRTQLSAFLRSESDTAGAIQLISRLVDWKPSPRLFRPGYHRINRQARSARLQANHGNPPSSPRPPCPNCNRDWCPGEEGCESCAACGKIDCFITRCPDAAKKCLCGPTPHHLKEQCPFACRPCWQEGVRENDCGRFVRAVECTKHCFQCGLLMDEGHNLLCHGRSCRQCGQNWHMTQNCPDLVCCNWLHIKYVPVDNVRHSDNCQCCRHCGHPKYDSIPGMEGDHACQWRRDNQRKRATEWEGDNGILLPIMLCRKRGNHEVTVSDDLESVRLAGYARMMIEMDEYMSKAGRTPGEQPPYVTRPVIECRQCFALAYEGGDYEKQIPGRLRS